MKRTFALLTLLAALIGSTLAHAEVMDQKLSRYKVTITNLTRGQAFSPPVIATHSSKFQLYKLGAMASPGIAQIAEDGITATLVNEIKMSGTAKDIEVGSGPIMPGASQSYEIQGSSSSVLSLATMLVTTNDAFAGLSRAMLPNGRASFYLTAYDSGSEANTESCAHVPAPPCSAHNARATEGAEGYVHVHAGIQGIADLAAEKFDWRNPVALVTVEKM